MSEMSSTTVPPPPTNEPALPYIVIEENSKYHRYHLYEGPEAKKELLQMFTDTLSEWNYDQDDIEVYCKTMTRREANAINDNTVEYILEGSLTEKEIENIKKVLNCPTCHENYLYEWDSSAGEYCPYRLRKFYNEEYACHCDELEEWEEERRREEEEEEERRREEEEEEEEALLRQEAREALARQTEEDDH